MYEITDIDSFLSDRLTNAKPIQYSRTARRAVMRCYGVGDDPLEPIIRCSEGSESFIEKYSDVAKIDSAEVIEIRDLIFLEERIKEFPEKVRMQRQQFFNCNNLTPSVSIAMSITANSSNAVSLSKSVSRGRSIGLSLSYSGIFGSASTNISFSKTVSIGEASSWSESESVSRSVSVNIPIPSNTAGIATLLVYETTVEIPFEASVVVDGSLIPNESGYSKASEILPEEERITKIEGTLRIQGVSDSVFTTKTLPGKCTDDANTELPTKVTETFEFLEMASTEKMKDTKTFLKDALSQDKYFDQEVELFRATSNIEEKAATIGPIPDGVHYTILYVREVMKMDPICGFNDVGFPNNATFRVEGRQYMHYLNGNIISQWFEEKEMHIGCVQV
ncbi:MAG: hypothetical protein ABJO57_12965 [Lentilitoribacter sp.]